MISRFVLLGCVLVGCSGVGSAQSSSVQSTFFSDWPAGVAPQEVGKQLAEHFVTSPHQYTKTIHYSEIGDVVWRVDVCTVDARRCAAGPVDQEV